MNKDTFKVGDLMYLKGTKKHYLITECNNMYSYAFNNEQRTRVVLWSDHGHHYKELNGYQVFKVKPHIKEQEG